MIATENSLSVVAKSATAKQAADVEPDAARLSDSDPVPNPAPGRYETRLASSAEDLALSQKLRFNVFAKEMGADVGAGEDQLDQDRFDQHCDHLLVFDRETAELVSSTRLLDRAGAEAVGSYYSETEFEMSAIKALPGNLLEVGRTCVHSDYRNGAVIASLWQGLGSYIQQRGVAYVMGCASIEWGSDGAMVHAVTRRMQKRFMTPPELRVTPKIAVPHAEGEAVISAIKIPPLMKAYVSLGALVCGDPCWDKAFAVADLLVLLRTEDMASRYARHFLKQQET